MKIHKLNPGIMIIVLGVLSFLVTLFLFRFPEFFYDAYPFGFTLLGSIFSLILLLGLCSISASIIFWAYSKLQVPQYPRQVWVCGLLISALSVLLSTWMGFQQYKLLQAKIPDEFADIPLSTGYFNFFAQGLEPVLLTCAVITISLLWIPRWRNRKEFSTSSSGTDKMEDMILVISTLVVFAFFVKSIFRFMTITITIWALSRG